MLSDLGKVCPPPYLALPLHTCLPPPPLTIRWMMGKVGSVPFPPPPPTHTATRLCPSHPAPLPPPPKVGKVGGVPQKVGSYVKHTWEEVRQEMRDSGKWDDNSEEDEDEEGEEGEDEDEEGEEGESGEEEEEEEEEEYSEQ